MKKLLLAATALAAISTSAQAQGSLITDTFDILSKIPTTTFSIGPVSATSAHARFPTMLDVMLGDWCAKEGEATYDGENNNGVGVY
jgi:hypothetical protein